MALTEYERETIILLNDGEDVARIRTHQRKVITQLKKNPSAVLLDEGVFEGTGWAEFTIPASLVSFRKQERKQLTQEQRDKMRAAIMERKPWEKK